MSAQLKNSQNPNSIEVGDIVSRELALTHAENTKWGERARFLHYYVIVDVSYFQAALKQFLTGEITIESINFIEAYYDNHGKKEMQYILYG